MIYNELYHYGVKGMKWGVRKARRYAKKDAKEFVRAKMFYGEGAGTRRKLIKNKVEQRIKDQPNYKKAFDEELSKQDMAKAVSRANVERKAKDAKNTTVKTGRGIVNAVTGHPERLGGSIAVAYAGYMVMNKTGVDKVIARNAKKAYNDIKNYAPVAKGRQQVKKMMGL